MSEQFTIHRAAEGPGWPFGASAVAAASALLGGIVGLVTPMAALDWLAYQSYLDQIAGLTPPLGTSAKLAFVVLLAVLLGATGYFVARWAGVRSTGGFTDLLARLRGVRDEDEEDAPRLRGSDRHPDAPARRPLSATRDLTVERASAGRGTAAADAFDDFDDFDDDEDELLLISPMAAALPVSEPAPSQPVSVVPTMPPPVMPSPTMAALRPATAPIDWPDVDLSGGDDDFDLPAPHADDWLVSPAPAPVASATLGEMRQADVRLPIAQPPIAPPPMATPVDAIVTADPIAAATEAAPRAAFTPEFARVTRTAAPPPLDLSAARLDELIARVEAGMMRRVAAPVAAMVADVDGVEMPAPVAHAASVPSYTPAPDTAAPVTEEADPSFPNDPALAAALATLRRMAAA